MLNLFYHMGSHEIVIVIKIRMLLVFGLTSYDCIDV